ncbi:MAG: hypothetical protein KME35_16000 [Aphanocapsa sp. GSE-SYN-MK-11-07L]|jgi:hypothetical protein|nr:hypothetical protein [Aphanocapsa sp. GSE-SYN-MK-11-07L]
MKIVRATTTELKLKQQLLGAWGLSGFAFLVGLFLFVGYEFPVDWLGGGCIAAGGLIQALTPIETCTFDKYRQQVVFTRHHWLKRWVTRYAIAQIAQVRVEQHVWAGTVFYRVGLLLESGQSLALTRFPTTDLDQQQNLASSIRRFLRSA